MWSPEIPAQLQVAIAFGLLIGFSIFVVKFDEWTHRKSKKK